MDLRSAVTARPRSQQRNWLWLLSLSVPGILLLVVVSQVFAFYTIPTGAMEDTLRIGDRMVADMIAYRGREPQRGDIVILRFPIDPAQTFIKRVVGVPGGRIRIENKKLIRNGQEAPEPWVQHKTDYTDLYRDNFPSEPNFPQRPDSLTEMLTRHVRNGEVVVPRGHFFVMGDNRDHSLDSRYWGFVPRQDVIGAPLVVLYNAEDGGRWFIRPR